jgi:chromate transporter
MGPPSLAAFLLYFLRLGTWGFGGPIALAGHMQQDLVERRGWVSASDYKEGLALAQLAPGPLAAQLAMYLGWVRAQTPGATLVALAFIGPSFAMVLVLSWLYVRFGGLPWMQALFYGIGAAVIAIIARSVVKLARMTLGRDRLLWVLCAASAVVTAWTESEVIWVFLLCGLVPLLVRRPESAPTIPLLVLTPAAPALTPTLAGPGLGVLWQILGYFAGAGLFVFGSGLAIVPFLYGGVVQHFHWSTERQFIDAVAVSMITPGPVVITVAFIGYLVAGLPGAVLAAVGVFLPVYAVVVLVAPHFHRLSRTGCPNLETSRRHTMFGSSASRLALPLLAATITACSGCGADRDDDEDEERATTPASMPATASAVTPPAAQAAGALAATTWTFDSAAVGQAPPGFSFGRTGSGRAGRWVVRAAPDAPSGPNVLTQEDSDRTDYRFPVAVADGRTFGDVSLSVRCKPVGGRVDQACGIVWRYRDENNYYLARANALEDNVRFYYVQNGRRVQLAGWNGKVTSGVWHELRADVRGDRVEVYYDRRKVIEARDARFSSPGKVGVWTKADSHTLFDNLTASPPVP